MKGAGHAHFCDPQDGELFPWLGYLDQACVEGVWAAHNSCLRIIGDVCCSRSPNEVKNTSALALVEIGQQKLTGGNVEGSRESWIKLTVEFERYPCTFAVNLLPKP